MAPPFVVFTLGPETNPRLLADTETAPLLVGRWRAVAPQRRPRPSASSSSLASAGEADADATLPAAPVPVPAPLPHRPQSPGGTCAWGYGSLGDVRSAESAGEDVDSVDSGDENPNNSSPDHSPDSPPRIPLRDLWLTPTHAAVGRAVARWWSRWALLVVLPAAVAVAWCAVPFPQCPLGGDDEQSVWCIGDQGLVPFTRAPAHGEARVRIRFWFFLVAYYGPYNVTALLWITKVFNLYSLNWWPPALGFPLSVSLLAALSLAVPAGATLAARGVLAADAADWLHPAPALVLAARGLLALARHNTAWVTWTFAVMAMPVAAALAQLLRHERHLRRPSGGVRLATATGAATAMAGTAVTEAAWWGDADVLPRRWRSRSWWRRVCDHVPAVYDNNQIAGLPASFVRFLWLMAALFTSLLVYVLGEAAAALFVGALPAMRHATVSAVAYVYGWTVIVFLLDALTGWILGGHQGERVGSYPLGWVFKLYFMLTYQTYVRALYVRLRSPSQFVYLQVLSSTTLVVLSPVLMSPWTHRLLVALRLNGQPYAAFQKNGVRNVFVRIVAENASMLAFLGSLLVLRCGPNRPVYPYLADDDDPDYTFAFTLYASAITWACELVAAAVVAALIRYFYRLRVVAEGQRDLAAWPELLPTSVAVAVHVLQNMLFSIIRLRFC